MPASASRVSMPLNNRVHSSRALQTHAIWSNTIGYDPYAEQAPTEKTADVATGANAFEANQELFEMARKTWTSNADIGRRGSCKKCNEDGHLTYQCRNFIKLESVNEAAYASAAGTAAELSDVSSTSSDESSEDDSALVRKRRKEERKRKKEQRKLEKKAEKKEKKRRERELDNSAKSSQRDKRHRDEDDQKGRSELRHEQRARDDDEYEKNRRRDRRHEDRDSETPRRHRH